MIPIYSTTDSVYVYTTLYIYLQTLFIEQVKNLSNLNSDVKTAIMAQLSNV